VIGVEHSRWIIRQAGAWKDIFIEIFLQIAAVTCEHYQVSRSDAHHLRARLTLQRPPKTRSHLGTTTSMTIAHTALHTRTAQAKHSGHSLYPRSTTTTHFDRYAYPGQNGQPDLPASEIARDGSPRREAPNANRFKQLPNNSMLRIQFRKD
jgi:hypothetical protein